PLPELTQDIVDRDHQFWSKYSERLIGNWITYDTPVSEICAFAERTYLRHDFKGFIGDRKFVRDDNAQKAFSKLRSSIGGIYAWRAGPGNPKSPAEQQRMLKEADFAFRQSFAYCPYSPEAVYRYVNLLMQMQRWDDALAIAQTCEKLDKENGAIKGLVLQVQGFKDKAQSPLAEAFHLMQNNQPAEAIQALNRILQNPQTDAQTLMGVAQAFLQLKQVAGSEAALTRLAALTPDNAETWYNLGGLQAAQGKIMATQALQKAFALNDKRRATDPKATNLREYAKKDPNLESIRNRPEFQQWINSK
ncbi:MAG: DUF2723 domain-containing protein, partial [Verrucomicrobiota bacterium]